MSNPGVIFLTKYQRDSFYFAVEDNIGEAIHIHYADLYINKRIDLTTQDFFNLASDIEKILDEILDGRAKVADFDPIFLSNLGYDHLINIDHVTTDSVMLEDLMVDDYLPNGKKLVRPMTEARLGKAFKDDHSENDEHYQLNYFLPTGKISNNRERIIQNFERINENGGFSETDYVWLHEDTNFIRDGHHRAMSLYTVKGNVRVPVKRLWFRKNNFVEYSPSVEEKVNNLVNSVESTHSRITELHRHVYPFIDERHRYLEQKMDEEANTVSNRVSEIQNSIEATHTQLKSEIEFLHKEIKENQEHLLNEINEKTSLRHFAGQVKAFLYNRLKLRQ